MPFLPPDRYGTPVFGLLLVWSGDSARGRAPSRRSAIGTPLGDLVRPVPYLALQSMLDGSAPHGKHYYWRSHRLPELADAVIERIVGARRIAHLAPLPAQRLGDRRRRESRPPGATAVGEREVGFELRLIAAWPPGDPDGERHTAWVREGWEALRPHGAGVVRRASSPTRAPPASGRPMAIASPGSIALKDRYDPTNVFRLNANIPPSGRQGASVLSART